MAKFSIDLFQAEPLPGWVLRWRRRVFLITVMFFILTVGGAFVDFAIGRSTEAKVSSLQRRESELKDAISAGKQLEGLYLTLFTRTNRILSLRDKDSKLTETYLTLSESVEDSSRISTLELEAAGGSVSFSANGTAETKRTIEALMGLKSDGVSLLGEPLLESTRFDEDGVIAVDISW